MARGSFCRLSVPCALLLPAARQTLQAALGLREKSFLIGAYTLSPFSAGEPRAFECMKQNKFALLSPLHNSCKLPPRDPRHTRTVCNLHAVLKLQQRCSEDTAACHRPGYTVHNSHRGAQRSGNAAEAVGKGREAASQSTIHAVLLRSPFPFCRFCRRIVRMHFRSNPFTRIEMTSSIPLAETHTYVWIHISSHFLRLY
jgi:hypothetical protein